MMKHFAALFAATALLAVPAPTSYGQQNGEQNQVRKEMRVELERRFKALQAEPDP